MFSDMFDTAEDILGGTSALQILNVQQRRPKNCAGLLDLPPISREEFGFVGLKNQGATCYLNSLVQSLYMSPEFRNAILSLPLCEGDDQNKKTDFVDSQNKQKLLMGFQKMFGELQGLDVSSLSTTQLTSGFGWEANEAFQQQDIQEANRIIFDTLERALFGTAVEKDPTSYYKGTIVNHITCTECQVPREREENFCDMMLQVENMTCLEESLMAFITPELLDGSNKLFCDICNKKCDTLKGQKIRHFPDILTFSLNRFTFDYNKMERVKLNTRYEFGLELNIAPFIENTDVDDTSEECNYELQTVLIHRGSAHGGHYITYIRDFLGEGNWEEKMKQYAEEREKREKDFIEEQERKQREQDEKEKKEEDIKSQKNEVEEEGENQKQPPVEVEAKEDIEIDESNLTVQEKRELKKKQKQQKKQQSKQQKPKEEKKKQNEDKKNDKKKINICEEYEFDDLAFPREFQNKKLADNWYSFNDHLVKSISYNRIQKQFGGKGAENAYILVYRKKSLEKHIPKPTIPQYIQKYIDEENLKVKQEREIYQVALQHIDIFIDSHNIFHDSQYTLKEGYEFEKKAETKRLRLDSTLTQLLSSISETTQIELQNLVLVELFDHANKYIQTARLIDISDSERTLEKADVSHQSYWIYYDRSKHQEILDRLQPHIGQEQIPLKLNIITEGKAFSMLMFSQDKLIDLKIKLQEITKIPEDEQYLTTEDLVHINDSYEKEEQNMNQLKITNDYDIIIKQIDKNTQKELQQMKGTNPKQLSEYQQAQLQGLVSVLVENSDETGVKRYFIDYKSMNLAQLLSYLKEKFNIENDSARRLRNLENKLLYYKDEYVKSLQALGFEEGGTRLLLERGEIPVSGNIPIRIRNSSNKKMPDTLVSVEVLISDDQTLNELKKQACALLKLEDGEHKLYKTDWLEDPIQLISNENQLIRNMNFKQQEILVLRDNDNPIDREFEKFSIFHTEKGSSDDSKFIGDLKIKKDELISDLKSLILAMPYFLKLSEESKIEVLNLRIRDMRKDGLFGQIYRNNEKKISSYNYSTNNLAIQILNEPDYLEEDDIVLILRKRNCLLRTYEDNIEFIYKSSKKPTVEEFKQSVADKLKISDLNSFEIVKYFPYEFQWKVISNEEYENLKENKKKADGKQKQKQKPNQNEKKNEDDKQENKDKQEYKENKLENKVEKQAQITQQNVKKPPYLIKDGDIIGYIVNSEKSSEKDDYQTENDQKMKLWYEEEKRLKRQGLSSSKTKGDVGGFKMNLDF